MDTLDIQEITQSVMNSENNAAQSLPQDQAQANRAFRIVVTPCGNK